MTPERIVAELEAMQRDLREMKRVMTIANTRYNKVSDRVNLLKRRLNAQIRKEQEASHATQKKEDERQLSLDLGGESM